MLRTPIGALEQSCRLENEFSAENTWNILQLVHYHRQFKDHLSSEGHVHRVMSDCLNKRSWCTFQIPQKKNPQHLKLRYLKHSVTDIQSKVYRGKQIIKHDPDSDIWVSLKNLFPDIPPKFGSSADTQLPIISEGTIINCKTSQS